MKKVFLKALAAFSTLLFILFWSVAVHAQNLPDEIIVTDTESLKVVPGGTYFYNIPKMLPGDSFQKNFQVSDTDSQHSYDLYFKTEPIEFSGDLNLLEMIELEIFYNDKLIYTGPLSGHGTAANGASLDTNGKAIHLSKLTPGTHDLIRTNVYLDGEKIGNEWQNAHCTMRWIFTAVREEKSTSPVISTPPGIENPGRSKNPLTADTIKLLIYIIGILASVTVLIVVLINMKKRKECNRTIKRGE